MKYLVNLRIADPVRKHATHEECVVEAADVETAFLKAIAANQRPRMNTTAHGCTQLPLEDDTPLGIVSVDDTPMTDEGEPLKPLTTSDFINAVQVGRPAEADEIDTPVRRGPGRPRKVA